MIHYPLIVVTMAIGIAPGIAPEAAYPRPRLLIEPKQLATPQSAGGCVILDARARQKYDAGHVPGARWVDHAGWAKAFKDDQDLAGWTQRIAELGVDGRRPVVIYDDSKCKEAARIWWILRYWGLDDVRLLNGGWHAWQEAGLPTTTESPSPPAKRVPLASPPHAERLAIKQQVLAALRKKDQQIVDARSQGEFCGTETMAKRGGAIPTAKHLEWSDLLDSKTHRFKTADEMNRLFREAGIDLNKPATTYCQSGGRASVMAFALELMGANDVRNYYASWAEWGNAEDTPVEPGKPSR
jgi:thiosulfate/3-mercaptopyruvate sulfurtransferase